MTSLVSSALSPSKDGTASLPRRQSSFARPPLRALYDLLIAPMEGVSARGREAPWRQSASPVLGALAVVQNTRLRPASPPAFGSWLFILDKAPSFQIGRSRFAPRLCSVPAW